MSEKKAKAGAVVCVQVTVGGERHTAWLKCRVVHPRQDFSDDMEVEVVSPIAFAGLRLRVSSRFTSPWELD